MKADAGKTSVSCQPRRTMDPAITLTALGNQPVVIDRTTGELRGALLPVLVPLPALSPAMRASWLLPHDDIDLAVRVSAALDAGVERPAWTLIAQQTNPLVGRLELVLNLWCARELARLGLPGRQNGWVLVIATPAPAGLESDATLALSSVRDMLSSLNWPRWSGPLLLVGDQPGASDPGPGRDILIRPAMPMLRLRTPAAGTTPAEDLAARLSTLALELTAPPERGWPAWLQAGLEEVAKAKVRGEGPSPLKMLALRQHAGTEALTTLLSSASPDRALCEALCAPLVHTRRRPQLPNFLDLLRHGVDVPGALRLAYGLTIDQLVSER
jgi:hypothetical protein